MQHINIYGPLIGVATFAVIGIFHPVVVRAHYRFGTGCWWFFLLLGLLALAASLFLSGIFWSAVCGVLAFTSLWTIKELFEQEKRVEKGWFPENPKRKNTRGRV